MKRLLSLAAAASASASAPNAALQSSRKLSGSSASSPRALQDGDGNSYAYLDDLTGYSLRYSNCLRVKIPQEGDDDQVEGNVNFYNGRYHAQYQIYATFHVCSYGNGDQCGSCDYGVEYASDVNTFLETSLDHWEGYCEACDNACRRRLEDADAGNDVDCNSCSSACKSYSKAANNGGDDESNYVDCQAAYEEDGLQLYYGPQCSESGDIVVGVFYDDECTIKTKHDTPNFDYYKFGTVTSGCVDCSSERGEEACGDLYGESFHCLNGKDQRGRDNDMNVCPAVKKATTSVDYSGVKKRRHAADAFLRVFFAVLLASLVGGFFFLTYTYYIRHRGDKSQPMLSSEDVHVPEVPPGATLT